MKKNLLEKEDKIDLRILETSQNLMAKIDQISHQEMERKKVLVLKENQVLLKKFIQSQMVSQTIQSILE